MLLNNGLHVEGPLRFSCHCTSTNFFHYSFYVQQVGITIAARKYDLDSSTPFDALDILNLQPVVKHSVPTCTDAKNLMEAGKVRMAEVYLLWFLSF